MRRRSADAEQNGGHQLDVAERLATLERRSSRQARRIAELEAQLQEEHRLHRRVAELTDLLTELLVPATARDDDRIHAALASLQQIAPD